MCLQLNKQQQNGLITIFLVIFIYIYVGIGYLYLPWSLANKIMEWILYFLPVTFLGEFAKSVYHKRSFTDILPDYANYCKLASAFFFFLFCISPVFLYLNLSDGK